MIDRPPEPSSPVRIWLSPPQVTPDDHVALATALASNWVAPAGPALEAFERAVGDAIGVDHAVALASGTAALHLALVVLGVGPGDEVLVSDLTFVACANAVRYVGATPVFVDADRASWNIDPTLVAGHLAERASMGRLPKALIVVDLYGQVADFERLRLACQPYDVPIIEDAAEALGATRGGRSAGAFGDLAVFSFNGNKIITTSGGGMLVSGREDRIERARYLATQARQPAPHYQHVEVGYNYRMSNLLAALGCSQLRHLKARVARRQAIRCQYHDALSSCPGVDFMPWQAGGVPSWWLTCLTVDPTVSPMSRDQLIARLAQQNIEARPVWKPMHLQPVYRDNVFIGSDFGQRTFETGLCLPSGSSLSDADVARITDLLQSCLQ